MIALTLWTALASAHALAPAGLDLTLIDPTHASVDWRTPVREPTGESLRPVWPEGCTLAAGDPKPDEAGALVVRGTLSCAAPLFGQEIGVDGLVGATMDVVITVRGEGGRVRRALLHDPVSRWTVAAPEEAPTASWTSTAPAWLGRALRGLAAILVVGACVEGVHRGREARVIWAQALGWTVGVAALVAWWCA